MKFGTLKTGSQYELVGIQQSADGLKAIPVQQLDNTMPSTLTELLQDEDLLTRAIATLNTAFSNGMGTSVTTEQLGPPIPVPGKILCIGLNYKDHAIETGAEIPSEPVVFGKFGNTIIGPEETILLPKVSDNVDYEAEMVAVIGKTAKHLTAENALEHIAGYMAGHDVSARDWQKGRPGKQWLLGKSPDTFAPIGPYFVTADEIADPHQLPIQLRLNGKTMQNSNTRELIFKLEALLVHLSQLMTLQPGDIIFTGTPAGVGMALDPQVFLKSGDVVEVEIEGLGILRNTVAAE